MTGIARRSREALLRGAWRSGAAALTRTLRSDRLVILRYHSVCDDGATPDYVSRSIAVPASAFDAQMAYLARHYRPISLDEAVGCMINRRPFPSRAVVVTFDDGYRDNFDFALQALTKHGVPATIYLVSSTLTEGRVLWTSSLRHALAHARVKELRLPELIPTAISLDGVRPTAESARTLTNVLNRLESRQRHAWIDRIRAATGAPAPPRADEWFLGVDQIGRMRSQGVEFGAHTVTHPNLPGIAPDEAWEEIDGSRTALSRVLGHDVVHFSYPNSGSLHPHVSDGVAGATRDAGYASAVTSHRGVCRPSSDRFRLRRIGINRARSPLPRFTLMIESTRLAREHAEVAVDD